MLAERVAADIRKPARHRQCYLPIFWILLRARADVVALAQVSAEGNKMTPRDTPGAGALSFGVPSPGGPAGAGRLTHAIPDMLAKLRQGLRSIDYPADKAGAFDRGWWHCPGDAGSSPAPGISVPLPQGDAVAEPGDSMGSELPPEGDSSQALLEPTASQAAALAEDPLPILWWVRGWN